jgi:hypothetical protein
METLQFNTEVFDGNSKEYSQKSLTIRTTPSNDNKEKTSKSYLILLGQNPNILVDSFEVSEEESSSDWWKYFEFFVVKNPLFIVVGIQVKLGA